MQLDSGRLLFTCWSFLSTCHITPRSAAGGVWRFACGSFANKVTNTGGRLQRLVMHLLLTAQSQIKSHLLQIPDNS